jgi:5-methylcytosine-specific restriction endonuclease McrA
MAFSKLERRKIYDRTYGKCHICWKKLSFDNYGLLGLKGNWEVEHSNPKSMGGTNRLNNLYAAHIICNRSKNNKSTKSARLRFGRTRAPLSKEKRKEEKRNNAFLGGVIGGIIGKVAGLRGVIIGATIGAKIGFDKDPDI